MAEADTLFNNFAVFDFEPTCVKNCKLVDTETTTWVGKHEGISVSITSNLLEEHMFVCDTEPHSLVSAVVNSQRRYSYQMETNRKIAWWIWATMMKMKLASPHSFC